MNLELYKETVSVLLKDYPGKALKSRFKTFADALPQFELMIKEPRIKAINPYEPFYDARESDMINSIRTAYQKTNTLIQVARAEIVLEIITERKDFFRELLDNGILADNYARDTVFEFMKISQKAWKMYGIMIKIHHPGTLVPGGPDYENLLRESQELTYKYNLAGTTAFPFFNKPQ